ncbi:alkaline phosphatase family protein [Aggregicoccus sp. 17bor-14]|uniref:hypothetical protein n=1 Tax=Myxococcaceae TaxID=31 RepID=UPI00129C41CE|nr:MULTISPECIES: hypothetical protein [Myxococcaceae]MBF5041957.1 hypothetical protein [Simulacricoccus sp. 17bor-14]MRI87738.1 alkaline phosphatase family protein [Aggregicoccus sp. 17bor-14]
MRRARRLALLAGLLALPLAGCDWDQFALLNSVPVHGDPGANPEVQVFLAVDGLSYDTVQDAARQDRSLREALGPGGGWSAAPFVSMFPATSDASWSRILRTPRESGYEYQYYDPVGDEVKRAGLPGLATHALPEFPAAPLLEGPPYYRAFDSYADGYLSTLWSYRDSEGALGDALDNLFFLLPRRGEFAHTFTGYLLEVDAMGHIQHKEDVTRAFLQVWRRIQDFKKKHPERRYVFTLLSDHGMDFQRARGPELLDFESLMPGLGLTPVKRLAEGRGTGQVYAIPIIHTRVSYLALHTDPELSEEVARRASTLNAVDVALARASPRPDIAALLPGVALEWYGLWRNGKVLVSFGYDPAQNRYYLPSDGKYGELGVKLNAHGGDDASGEDGKAPPFSVHTDEELFALTRDAKYPDLFFRARTALQPLSVEYPAQVLLSFRRPYASAGFKLPGGANEIASEGFHGALDAGSSRGTLLTEARALPSTVRSDSVMALFPALREHVEEKAGALVDADAHADLDYAQVEAEAAAAGLAQ